MAQKAIIHTATRVIFCVTTLDNPQIGSNQSIVELATPITIGGGKYWKLDGSNNLIEATQNDIDTSGVDDTRNAELRRLAFEEYKTAINELLSEVTIPARIKTVFQKYLNWINRI